MQTFGWDLVVACAAESINKQLAQNSDQMPATFSGQETVNGSTSKISGTFGAWNLQSGGSDGYLHFSAMITAGQLVLGVGTPDEVSFDLAGVCPVLALKLAFIDDSVVASVKNLAFDTVVESTTIKDSSGGGNVTTVNEPVQLITADSGSVLAKVAPYGVANGPLSRLLPQCLIDHPDKLAFVFGQLKMLPTNPDLKPLQFEYLYAEGPEIGDSGVHCAGYLVVLVQVDPRRNPGSITVDPELLKYDVNFSKPDRIIAVHDGLFMRLASPGMLRWPVVSGQTDLGVCDASVQVADDHVEAVIHIKANWSSGMLSSCSVDLTGTVKSYPAVNGTVITSDQVTCSITGTLTPDNRGDFGAQFQSLQDNLVQQMSWSFDLAALPWDLQINSVNAFLSGELLAVTATTLSVDDGGIQ